MSSYSRSRHSKYSLKVHLIFVTKYRKPIFCDNDMNTYIKNLFQDISIKHNYKIIQMETDKNHIHEQRSCEWKVYTCETSIYIFHILLEYQPNISVSTIVKQLKQYTTYQMWKQYENILSKYYWKQKILWSDGYFVCSIGQVSQSIIEKYIESQG